MCSLNLKPMFANIGIATILPGSLYFTVYINSKSHTTADASNNFFIRVTMRINAEAYVPTQWVRFGKYVYYSFYNF